MGDFLADNNLCGQTILKIVSKGNFILSELLKLKDYIPSVFKLENKSDTLKYGEIICDLSYFKNLDSFEATIENNNRLLEADDELRENYLEILTKFYILFESIYKYITDLSRFIEDVQNGFFIQMSTENILSNVEGKQLLSEAIYLYGVMLLTIDEHIEGVIRERILTSFYRYAGVQSSDTNIDDVCKLLRSSGYTTRDGKKPLNYPEEYFGRIQVNETFLEMLVGKLRSDDIYNQLAYYPLSEHRSVALASQSSILIVILYFCPSVLRNEQALMREITDKFFPDNWIISIYIDFHINLIDGWESFKAAKLALMNTIELQNIKNIGMKIHSKIDILLHETGKVLKEGIIVEENILERSTKVINLLRESNVVLRWIILHTSQLSKNEYNYNKKCRQVRDFVINETKFDSVKVLELLLQVSQLELKIKELFRKLLNEKETKWVEYRAEATERAKELAEVFSGNKPLTRIEKNEKLCKWLETKATQIEMLNFDQLLVSGRKIVEIMSAFNKMLEFHGLENNVQVREWVNETISCLHKMLRTGSINEDALLSIQIIGDLGYAWGTVIDNYTPFMQQLIKKDPTAVSKLRAVFLKLSSVIDMPLLRLNQAKSPELVTVTAYYSSELVSYVQKVLQIIPESVFSLLHEIIQIQTNSIKELPTRLDKDKIREFIQLEERYKVAKFTYDMSMLTEGILKMQSTLVGIIRVDPKKLLENGIRKELVKKVSQILNSSLNFSQKTNKETLLVKLEQNAQIMDGIRRSFEYVGDYVNAYGLKIFQEEFSRIVNFATEQECNLFTKTKVLHFQSIYQSREIPIPLFPSDDPSSLTFMGRLANELISSTNPKNSIYLPSTRAWYELKAHMPILTEDEFVLMEKTLDIPGLIGLDKIFSFMIEEIFQKLLSSWKLESNDKIINDLFILIHSELGMPAKLMEQPMKKYKSWTDKLFKLQNHILSIVKIGQIQLLRKRIRFQLKVSANINSKQLHNSVSLLNSILSTNLKENNGNKNSDISDTNSIILETLNHSESLGIYEPMSKLFIVENPIPFLPLQLALLTLQLFRKYIYSNSLGTLICKKVSEFLDIYPFAASINTILMQFNENQHIAYFSYLCQYLNSILNHLSLSSPNLSKEDLQEVANVYYYLKISLELNARSDLIYNSIRADLPSFDIIPNIINLNNLV